MDRAKMYGSVSDADWKGSYPNPSSIQERREMEMAMIRRKSVPSHRLPMWNQYSFYGYSNGEAQKFYPASDKHAQIMQVYKTKAEKETMKKFGASGKDVLSATGLASEVKLLAEDKNSTFIPEMLKDGAVADLMARKAATKASEGGLNKEIQEIMALSVSDEQAAIAKIEGVGKSLKKYGDALQNIIDLGSTIDASVGEMVVNHQESRIGDAVRLDAKSYTAALNVLEQVKFVNRITDQIEKDSSKLPNFGITGSKSTFKDRGVEKKGNQMDLMKWSGTKGEYKQEKATERAIETLTTNLQGSMTNYLGGIYEIAIASTLKTSFADIFSEVQMTGANTTTGPGATTVNLAVTPLGKTLQSRTSKTDIRTTLRNISDRANVEMNLSIKNQKFNPGKNSQTKALETGLSFLFDAILTDESHRSTMETAFMNDKMYTAASSMNSFLGALMADMAIAGLPGDRIDFMVYENAVIPLADYFGIVNRVSIAPTGSASKAVQSVIATGSTPIAFRVRTKGL